jgi:hypothetical protein
LAAQASMAFFSSDGIRKDMVGSRPVAGRPIFLFGIAFSLDVSMKRQYQKCRPAARAISLPALIPSKGVANAQGYFSKSTTIPTRRRKHASPRVIDMSFDWSDEKWVSAFIPRTDTLIIMLHHDAAELERVVAGLVAFRNKAAVRLAR